MFIGRGMLFTVPLIYAFASSVYKLILVEFIVGIIIASSDIAMSAYLLDISPNGLRGSCVGLFNAFVGIFTFLGSITGGCIRDIATILGLSIQNSMLLVYAISNVRKLVGGLLYLTLREPYKYPSKFG